jgi:hypothetical protein
MKSLPPSKINSTKLLGGSSFSTKKTSVSLNKLKTSGQNDFSIIKKQVFEIKNLITNITLSKKNEQKRKQKEQEKEKFEGTEKKLEKKKPKETGIKLPATPKLGFLDRIKNFLFNTFLGFIAVRLIEHLPKLIGVAKFLGGTLDFLTSVGGTLLNGLVTFVEKGYEVADFTRKQLRNFGGEGAVEKFDALNKAFENIIFAAIAASLALGNLGSGGEKGGGPGGKPGTGSNSFQKSTAAEKVKNARIRNIQKKYGPGARKIYENALNNGKTPQQAESAIKRGLKRGVSVRPGAESLSAKTASKGSIFSRGLGKAPGRVATKVLGKTGSKLAGKVFGKIPIIGGLVSFIISVLSGEPVGRAAAKAVGFSIGSALGTFIPVPFVGTILGGMLGDIVGGALYDTLTGGNKKQVVKAKGGGSAPSTRGGRIVTGPAKRKITKARRTVKVQSTPIKPGASIGGEKQIEKVFPKSEKIGTVNPLGYIEDTYKKTSEAPYFGSLMGIATKAVVGQKPSPIDYKNAAQGLSNWMNVTFSDEVLRTGALAAAGGGQINAEMLSKSSGDMTNVIAKSLEENISKKVDDAINDLMKQMMLKSIEKKPGLEGKDQFGEEGSILEGTTSGEYGPILDLIASVEAVGGYDVVNGGKIPGLSSMTISAARQEAMRSGGSGAMGRYQQMPQYVLDRARSIGLNPDRDLFNQENQNKLAILLINGGGYKKWKSGQMNTEQFAHNLSATWRGLPEGPSNKTYQDRYASRNKAHTSWANVVATLNAAKSGRIAGGQFGGGILGTSGVNAVDQFTPIAQKFGLQVTSAYRPGDPGYHGKNMARDYQTVGAPGNAGTPGQMQFAQNLIQNYGSSLKQLIYTPLGFGVANGKKVGLDYWGASTNSIHYDHVHVAFFHGGFVKKTGLHMLHKGEFVVDKDSVDLLGKDFIATINSIENTSQLKNKADSLINTISHIAGYEPGGQQDVVVEQPEPEIVYITTPVPIGGGAMVMGGSSGGSNFEGLHERG